MIRDALSVLPTRPILYIVPVVIGLVMSVYYWDIYTKCTDIKRFRTSLNEVLHSSEIPGQFRLTDFTGFAWDQVRIVANFKPEGRDTECPFDWNWPGVERDSLIASGLLTVLIFVQEGAIVKYHELRDDEVAFRGADSSLTPKAAVFNIGRNSVTNSGVTLTLNN